MVSRRGPSGGVILAKMKLERPENEDCGNRHSHHEEDSVVSGGIWIKGGIHSPNPWFANDRIIFAWLNYAGRYDVKTKDRHLAAIRYFETLTSGKPFCKLSILDVSKVREDLKRRSDVTALDHFSSSSIRHTVSHLMAFLNWLMKQEGFRRLPKDLPDYLKLPKAVLAAAIPTKRKVYPTLLEAEALLNTMPSKFLVDHRARAIFALAFLGSLRADTLVSLRIKHFDIENRLILQDASKVRAKGGKSLKIRWFPIQKSFEAVVLEWANVLVGLGFRSEDALFPAVKFLKHQFGSLEHSREPIPVMSSFYAVTKAFAIACRDNKIKFTPHAGKYTIGAERHVRPLTQLQRKAWSQSMGHENEQTTERYYGKLPDERCIEVMVTIGDIDEVDIFEFPDEAKIKLVNAVLEKFGKR